MWIGGSKQTDTDPGSLVMSSIQDYQMPAFALVDWIWQEQLFEIDKESINNE